MFNAQYADLLYHALPQERKDEFFSSGDESKEAGWSLFEVLYPQEAERALEKLRPLLEEVVKELKFSQKYEELIAEGDDLGAARLSVFHRASKLKWEND